MLRKFKTMSALVIAATVASTLAVPPAAAKLKCKDVSKRFQVCGDAKPFKKLVVGVGIRFSKKKPGLSAKTGAPKPTRRSK